MESVLVLHRGDSAVRGTEVCVIEAVRALAQAGARVVVARNTPVMDDALSGSAAVIEQLDYPELSINGFRSRLPLLEWARNLTKVSQMLREHRPSVIYTSGGLPCQLAIPAARFHNIPVVCHFHHPSDRRDYYVWLVKFADAHLFPSAFTAEHARSRGGIHGRVIPNGVDSNRFTPVRLRDARLRAQWNIADDAIVVGQVGQLVPHKRPDLLLRSFLRARESVHALHLCLVGSGPMTQQLREAIEHAGCSESITLTGYVDDVVPWYRDIFDINVLASVEEGLGLSAIEGSACGLPTIVADSSGLRETVVDGRTGLRVKPDDEVALAQALIELASDPPRRRVYGAAGRAFVVEHFSLDRYRGSIVAALQEVAVGR